MTDDLILQLARDVLGRQNLDRELARETAARLQALLRRIRAVAEERLWTLPPAFAFAPDHPAYRSPPLPGEPVWAGLARSGQGGSGYGGTRGTTGVETAPPPRLPSGPGPHGDLVEQGLSRLAAAVRRREVSPVELVEAALDRIEALDPTLNAFVLITRERALATARRAEEALLRGEDPGPLAGVPVAVKDVYEVAGLPTRAGSAALEGYTSAEDAVAVRRLEAAGGALVGKTATHEFAFGPTTDSPYHGPTRNPWDPTRIPGGSSGGSGAAVAAGLVPLALGTDTGGSIRIPAAACGVVGLKPSYGRIPARGILPLSWSLDHAGPLCRCVADAALALQVLAGPDPLDPQAAPAPVPDYRVAAGVGGSAGLRGLTLGVPQAWLEDRVDGGVRKAFEAALAVLADLGAAVVPVDLPPADGMMFVNRIITLGEAGAFHAPLLAARAEAYAPDVRARLELGQFLLARDYLTAQRLRGELAREVAQVMARVDALLTPTLPIPAAPIGQGMWTYAGGEQEPVAEALIRFTAPFSVTGQPALSVPCGFTEEGLPVGLQIVGRVFDEPTVLRIGAAYEAAAGWSGRRPPVR